MIAYWTRQRIDGSWPTVGTTDRGVWRYLTTRRAVNAARQLAQAGRAVRIEFYSEQRPYADVPLSTITVPAGGSK